MFLYFHLVWFNHESERYNGAKATDLRRQFTYICCWREECVEIYLHQPY